MFLILCLISGVFTFAFIFAFTFVSLKQECTASNEVSSIRHSAKLRIYGPPFVRPMDNVSAVAGEPLSLYCPVAGHPIDSIFWEKSK